MARLPRLFRTFLESLGKKNSYTCTCRSEIILVKVIFCMKKECYVYSLESPHRAIPMRTHNIIHMENLKDIPIMTPDLYRVVVSGVRRPSVVCRQYFQMTPALKLLGQFRKNIPSAAFR